MSSYSIFKCYIYSRLDTSLASQTHFREREGSGKLCIQALSHRNAISWMT